MTRNRQRELTEIILQMLRVFERLGDDPMARIDAREWHRHFRRKVAKLKL